MTQNSVDVNVITEKTDIASTLPSHLLLQFDKSDNLKTFLGLFSDELQELESDSVIPLLYQRTLIAAEGRQLDNIGEGLSILREGRDDESYRAILRVSSLQRRSRGAIDEILDILYYLTGVRLTHHFRGYGYYLQLGFNDTCISNQAVIGAVERVLPLMSNVQWINTHHERVFGCTSVFDNTPEQHEYVGGVGSVFGDDEGAGHVSSNISYKDRDYANTDAPRYLLGASSTFDSTGTELIRGVQTVFTDERDPTTESAGEVPSGDDGGLLTSQYNRVHDDRFRTIP